MSRNNVGQQLVLDGGDAVLERQLALLQAFDLQLIAEGRRLLRHDLRIQIAVLGPQPRQLLAELALVRSLHRPFGPSAGKPPALRALLSPAAKAGKPDPTARGKLLPKNEKFTASQSRQSRAQGDSGVGQGVTSVSHLNSLQRMNGRQDDACRPSR